MVSSRVRRYRLIPLTEPYVRTSYTAPAYSTSPFGGTILAPLALYCTLVGTVWFHHCGDVHCNGWRSSTKAIYQTWLQLLPLYDPFIQTPLLLEYRNDLSRWSHGLCINDKLQLFIKVFEYASPLRSSPCFGQWFTPLHVLAKVSLVFSSTPLLAFIGLALLSYMDSLVTSRK